MRRSPAVVDRKAIAEHAWADETDPLGSNAIDVQLSRLRAKLPERRHPDRHGPRRRLPAGGGVTVGRRGAAERPPGLDPRRPRRDGGRRGRLPRGLRRRRRASSSATSPTRSTSGSRRRSSGSARRPRPATTTRTRPRRPSGLGGAPVARLGRRCRTARSSTDSTNPALPAEYTGVTRADDRDDRRRRPPARRPGRRRRLRRRRPVARGRRPRPGSTSSSPSCSSRRSCSASCSSARVAIGRRVAAPIEAVAPAPARVHRRRLARAADAARRSSRPTRASPSPRPARRRLVPHRVRADRRRVASGCAGCSRTSSGWPGSTRRSGRRTPSRSTSAVLAGADRRPVRADRRDAPPHARPSHAPPDGARRSRRRPNGSTGCSASCSTTPASTRRTAAVST